MRVKVACPFSGVTATMPVHDPAAWIQRHWASGTFYERALQADAWQRYGRRDLRRIYDIGANVGNHTVWFGLAWPAAAVYAFEPAMEPFDVLVEAVKGNGLMGRTMLCPYGLGSHNDRGTMVRGANEGMWRLIPGDDVSVYALDALAFSPPDLIKIDAEGMELGILDGARQTLERWHPPIYVEGDRGLLDDFLGPMGYQHRWTGCATPTHLYEWEHAR